MTAPLTEKEWDAVSPELKALCLLRLLRRPAVRRWAAREFGFPPSGPLTQRQLAAWCGVDESTISRWERDAIIKMRGAARRCGLTQEISQCKH
jgi:hypothetical protein